MTLQKFPHRTLQVKPGQKLDQWFGSREAAAADAMRQSGGSSHPNVQAIAGDTRTPESGSMANAEGGHRAPPAAAPSPATGEGTASSAKIGAISANSTALEHAGPSRTSDAQLDGVSNTALHDNAPAASRMSPVEAGKLAKAGYGSSASLGNGEATGALSPASYEPVPDGPAAASAQLIFQSEGDANSKHTPTVESKPANSETAQGGLDGYVFGDLFSGQETTAEFAPSFSPKGLSAALTDWSFPIFSTSFDAPTTSSPDNTGSSQLSVSMGGFAFAAGHESATSGLIEAKVVDLGPVTVAKGVVQFSGAAQNLDGSQAVAGAESYAELTGADFVLTVTTTMLVIDNDSMVAVSTTKFWGVDIEGWAPAGGPIAYHAGLDSLTAFQGYEYNLPIIGNVADSRALATAIGGDTFADVTTVSLVRSQEVSIVNAQAFVGVA